MKISEAFEIYREREVRAAGLSSHTDESYFYACKHVVQFMGNVNVQSIDITDVTKFYEHLTTWQRPDTARLYIVCLRAVIKYLKRKNYIGLDPKDIKVPRLEKRAINYLIESEVDALRAVAAQRRAGLPEINRRRNIALVELTYSSGARIGEICRLNRNSIKNNQFIAIGKSKNPRPCYVSKKAAKALSNYLILREDNSLALFIANQTGNRLTPGNAQEIFRNLRSRCNLGNLTPHTLRHSFATSMLSHGVDLRYIGDMLGHQSLDTTRIYTHYENSHLKRIHNKVMD